MTGRFNYAGFKSIFTIQNALIPIAIWVVYMGIIFPLTILASRFSKFAKSAKKHMLYHISICLMILTFIPIMIAALLEFKNTPLETDFEFTSFLFSMIIYSGIILFVTQSLKIVYKYHKFKDLQKIKTQFRTFFLYFKSNVLSNFYWPIHLVKWTILSVIFVLVSNSHVHILSLLLF